MIPDNATFTQLVVDCQKIHKNLQDQGNAIQVDLPIHIGVEMWRTPL
jgi:hypothetical protein